MNQQWVVQLYARDAVALSQLRTQPGLQICEEQELLWLRTSELDEALSKAVRALPGRRFTVLPDQQLLPVGKHVPHGYLPEGPWTDLRQWMTLQIQPPRFSAVAGAEVAWQLVRGGEPAEANVLLTDARFWREYAIRAPRIRLDRLGFALSENAQAVLRGTPLPPLPGIRFVERSGVAAPAGWIWMPAVDADVLQAALDLAPQDLALLYKDGTWDHIPAEAFVQATRSAVRRSIE